MTARCTGPRSTATSKMVDVLLDRRRDGVEPLTRMGDVHAAAPGQFARTRAPRRRGLLAAGSKPEAVTATGVQPMHLAAQAGNADADQRADRYAAPTSTPRDETHGRTPLVFAASQNRLDAMKVLLAKGADAARRRRSSTTRQRSSCRQRRACRPRSRDHRADRQGAGHDRGAAFTGNPNAATGSRGGTRRRRCRRRQSQRWRRPGSLRPDIPQRGAWRARRGGDPNAPRPASDIQQIGKQGGFTALHYAAREGFADAATAVARLRHRTSNLPTAGDRVDARCSWPSSTATTTSR